MARSINEVTICGRLGRDPEVKTLSSGRVCSMRVAVTESWKDKATQEWKEKTEWVPVVVWVDGVINQIDGKAKKGSSITVRGRFETRSYKSNNDEKETYVTEVVVRGIGGYVIVHDQGGQGAAGGKGGGDRPARPQAEKNGGAVYNLDDDIPFMAEFR